MKFKVLFAAIASIALAIYFLRPTTPQAPAEPEPVIEQAPTVVDTPVVEQKAAPNSEKVIEEAKQDFHSQPPSPLLSNVVQPKVEKEKSKAEQFFEDFKKERVLDPRFKRENERMLTREIIQGPFNHKGSGLSHLAVECRQTTCLLTGKSRYPIHDDMMVNELQMQLEHRNVRVEQIDYNRRTNSFAIALYPEKD